MTSRDEIRLAIPAAPEFVRLARVTASGLASRMGFTYEEVDDLRLAIDELCFALMGPSPRAGRVDLRYAADGAGLTVEGVGSFADGDGAHRALDPFSEQILGALVDHYEVYRDEHGKPAFRLVKRGGGTPPPPRRGTPEPASQRP